MAYMLKYGDGSFPVALPDDRIGFVVEPNPTELPEKSPEELIEEALDSPVGRERLENIVRPGETACIVVSDSTRAWQKPALMVRAIIARLNAGGIRDEDITVLSARGTHRAQSAEELSALVSPEIYARVRVIDHDPLDKEHLRVIGTTSRGTPVALNTRALDADRVILTGSVLHHFLAGFSGGRKSVVPGIAAMETVQANHRLSLAAEGFDPAVRSGNTIDNPVHLDMCEAAAMLEPDFLLNTVMDSGYRMVRAFAGDWREAHTAACALVDEMNRVTLPRRYPVVIASAGGYPKDLNVYQPLKTLCHMTACTEPGGTMIMLSESREGFGSADTELQMTGYDTMEERSAALRAHYTIGGATGFLYADAAEKYRFIYVTKLDAELFSHTKMRIIKTLDEALALAGEIPAGGVCLMPSGSVTLPEIEETT